MTMLDVAVGTGQVARAGRKVLQGDGHLFGLDPSLGMLGQARRTVPIPLLRGFAERIPLADDTVDFLSMGYALRHVSDLVVAFREYHRVLKPGGVVLLLELSRPTSLALFYGARFYLRDIVPGVTGLLAGKASRTLMRYFWDTIENCVPPRDILDALASSGLEKATLNQSGIFGEYTRRQTGSVKLRGPASSTTMPCLMSTRCLLATLCLLSTAVSSGAQDSARDAGREARSAGERTRLFEPAGKYALEIDGEAVPDAGIYLSLSRGSALLIETPELPAPLLLRPDEQRLDRLRPADLVPLEDGAVDLVSGAELEPVGTYAIDGASIAWTLDDRQARPDRETVARPARRRGARRMGSGIRPARQPLPAVPRDPRKPPSGRCRPSARVLRLLVPALCPSRAQADAAGQRARRFRHALRVLRHATRGAGRFRWLLAHREAGPNLS